MDELMFPPQYRYYAVDKEYVDIFWSKGPFMFTLSLCRIEGGWYWLDLYCWPFTSLFQFQFKTHPA